MGRMIGFLSLIALLSALCTNASAADPPANRGEVQRDAERSNVWSVVLDHDAESWKIVHSLASFANCVWVFENGEFVACVEPENPLIVETLDPGNTVFFYELDDPDGGWLYVGVRFTGRGTLANANGKRP